MLSVVDERGRTLTLEAPLDSGAEGEIRPIRELPNHVAKIFHRPEREMADKLAAMIKKPPQGMNTPRGSCCFAWPEGMLFAARSPRQVVGYWMLWIRGQRVLHATLQRVRTDATLFPRYAIQAAENIARLVAAAHGAGYVIGDINEKNILVGRDGSASIVDTDSFQVCEGSNVHYCRVARREYTAPELHQKPLTSTFREPSHDCFPLAVLFHQLFQKGDHPFRSLYTGSGNPPPLAEKIAGGLWPFASGGLPNFAPPHGGDRFRALPAEIQTLFRECFEDGHRDPLLRPTANDWIQGLLQVRGQWPTRVGRAKPGITAPWAGALIPSRRAAAVGAGLVTAAGLVGAATWSVDWGVDWSAEENAQPAVEIRQADAGAPTPELWLRLKQ
jgi:DNA-binding helix-hairpin-helix protein with protein kinase domain